MARHCSGSPDPLAAPLAGTYAVDVPLGAVDVLFGTSPIGHSGQPMQRRQHASCRRDVPIDLHNKPSGVISWKDVVGAWSDDGLSSSLSFSESSTCDSSTAEDACNPSEPPKSIGVACNQEMPPHSCVSLGSSTRFSSEADMPSAPSACESFTTVVHVPSKCQTKHIEWSHRQSHIYESASHLNSRDTARQSKGVAVSQIADKFGWKSGEGGVSGFWKSILSYEPLMNDSVCSETNICDACNPCCESKQCMCREVIEGNPHLLHL